MSASWVGRVQHVPSHRRSSGTDAQLEMRCGSAKPPPPPEPS
ncbi:MAG: hypothetical protein M5U28_43585 [Sandaracinaceae bacterium]|nr:hypothetical protein [Sandaracinaceae bacterium]